MLLSECIFQVQDSHGSSFVWSLAGSDTCHLVGAVSCWVGGGRESICEEFDHENSDSIQ